VLIFSMVDRRRLRNELIDELRARFRASSRRCRTAGFERITARRAPVGLRPASRVPACIGHREIDDQLAHQNAPRVVHAVPQQREAPVAAAAVAAAAEQAAADSDFVGSPWSAGRE
jgi:hypothetical protein